MKRSASISFGTGPAPLRVQIAGFAIVALITGTIAVWTGLQSWKLDKTGIRTTGVVVETAPTENTFYPVFEFTDTMDRRHTVRARVSNSNYPVGSTVPVLYPEDRPLRAQIDSRGSLYFATIITGALCIAFLLGMFALARFRRVFQGIFASRVGKLRIARKRVDGKVTRKEYSSVPLLTWVSRISGVVILLLLVGVAWTAWNSYRFVSTAIEVEGIVVGLVLDGGSYKPQVDFASTNGTSHSVVLPDKSADYLAGHSITVLYPPGDPSSARLPKWHLLFGWTLYFGLLTLVFLAVRTMTRIQLSEITKANDRRGWE